MTLIPIILFSLASLMAGWWLRGQRNYDAGYAKGRIDAEKAVPERIIRAKHEAMQAARRCMPATTSKE